jgi:GNAT superfamily N-acetyltransferase
MDLIRALAAYEQLSHEVVGDETQLHAHLFGLQPAAHVLIGLVHGEVAGFALYFTSFSTFLTRPGIYLEDLFVRPEARGRDLGKALIGAVAARAVERGCARFEWAVLDWNRPAIEFYHRLGARMMDDWRIMRLEGAALGALGRGFTAA